MRNRIMMAAVAEMGERGVKFTMSDLARRLGVSKRCLYEHFASKDELISAIIDAFLLDIREQRQAILADTSLSFREKLIKILSIHRTVMLPMEGRMADEIKRFIPAEWEKIEQFMSQDWSHMERFLQQGIDSGHFRPVYLPVFEKMLKGCVNAITDYSFLVQHNVSLQQAKSYMIDILIHGLIPSEQH